MRPQPIDEEFSDSYQTKGLQPLGLTGNISTNSRAADRYQAANDREKENYPQAANDEETNVSRYPVKNSYSRAIPGKNITSGSALLNSKLSTVSDTVLNSKALQIAAKVKVAATNVSIYSWAFPVWFFVQLPLALFGLGFIGLAASVDAARNAGGVTGFFTNLGVSIVEGVAQITDSVFGTNIVEITDPSSYAIAITSIIFFIGIIKLMTIGLIYQLSFTNTLFGSGSALKICAIILAIFGYFFPFLNLLPWFFVWTFVVALYPR